MTSNAAHECAACGRPDSTLFCPKCKVVRYCGAICMKMDGPNHNDECSNMKSSKKRTTSTKSIESPSSDDEASARPTSIARKDSVLSPNLFFGTQTPLPPPTVTEEIPALSALRLSEAEDEAQDIAQSLLEPTPVKVDEAMNSLTKLIDELKPTQPLKILSRLYTLRAGAYTMRTYGDPMENMDDAIRDYKYALRIMVQLKEDLQAAELSLRLGALFMKRLRPERAMNINTAIQLFEQALKVYQKYSVTEKSLRIQFFLGDAYDKKMTGDPDHNIEMAKKYYEVITHSPDASPSDWAFAHIGMGNYYANLKSADEAETSENIESAIRHMNFALKNFTRQNNPKKWATIMCNLGLLYGRRKSGDRASNLDESIRFFTLSLDVLTFKADPEKFAVTQQSLGMAYKNRVNGNKNENFEKTIYHQTQSLQTFTKEDYPHEWAATTHNIGKMMKEFGGPYLPKAIESFTKSTEIRNRVDFPEKWAQLQLLMAECYCSMTPPDLGNAIRHYEEALEVLSVFLQKEKWASAHEKVSQLYCEHTEGDPNECTEASISHAQYALQEIKQEDNAHRWATLNKQLGERYLLRTMGNVNDNMDKATKALTDASLVFTRSSYPSSWVSLQRSFGEAYSRKNNGDVVQHKRTAIHYYDLAQELQTVSLNALDWAEVELRLGLLNAEIDQNRIALEHYDNALKIFTAKAYPDKYAELQELIERSSA